MNHARLPQVYRYVRPYHSLRHTQQERGELEVLDTQYLESPVRRYIFFAEALRRLMIRID